VSYRRRAAAPGGRRDHRERAATRTRTTRVFAGGIALSAFAVGSFASVGVNAFAQEGPAAGDSLAVATEVEPVSAAAADIQVVTRTEEETIEHSSVEQDDASELEGTKKVVTEGEDGTALVSYTVTLQDGEEVDREGGIRVVVDEPVDEVIAVGTKKEPVLPAIPATTNAGANRALGRELAAQRGWTGEQWECLNALFTKESNWRHNAQNPSSGAYGIPQSLPGSKMASVASDWRTNPATQITWGLNYIKSRYGTPCGAWSHSVARGWY